VKANGVGFQQWKTLMMQTSSIVTCNDMISYQPYGKVGYINFCSFSVGPDSMFQQLERRMADIFEQIQKDKVDTLIVDVSNNAGGNSACGNLIADYFYAKPYQRYQCKWRRSEEYLELMKKWGATNTEYQKSAPGSVLFYPSSKNEPTRGLKNRFNGKVYVVVGANTFSSAIMFATMVKDNQMATLVGQIPENGHPNHFGEMFGSKTPNASLQLQFGVKEWIRPSGDLKDNRLIPDKMVDLEGIQNVEDLIARIMR
jgi:C-terminal processing protease CtpA/Prc